jgi:CheY-like chemotaxis protein
MATPTRTYRLLLAEDEDDSRELLQRALQLRGFVVDAVCNGEDAIARWEEARRCGQPYCACLLDISMPDKTGFEVTKHIRSHQQMSGTPVLLMTGYEEPLIVGHAAYVHADEVVFKPIDLADLIMRIKELCGVKERIDSWHRKLNEGDSLNEDDLALAQAEMRTISRNRDLPRARRVAADTLLASLRATAA